MDRFSSVECVDRFWHVKVRALETSQLATTNLREREEKKVSKTPPQVCT